MGAGKAVELPASAETAAVTDINDVGPFMGDDLKLGLVGAEDLERAGSFQGICHASLRGGDEECVPLHARLAALIEPGHELSAYALHHLDDRKSGSFKNPWVQRLNDVRRQVPKPRTWLRIKPLTEPSTSVP